MKFSKNIGSSIIFIILLVIFADAQTAEFKNIVEVENSAKKLAKQWNSESIRSSIALYSEAAEKWAKADEPVNASRCVEEQTRLYLQLGENEKALLKLSESLKSNSAEKLLVQKSRTESLLSTVYLRMSKNAESKKYFELAEKDAEKSGDKTALAMAYFSAAEYVNAQSEFEKAITYYQKSAGLFKETGNFQKQAEILTSFAYVYMVLGEPQQGLIKAHEAETVFRENGEQRGIKLSQIAVGHLLSTMDEKQSALEYYLQANEDFPDDLDLIEKAALLNGLGKIYEDYGDFVMSLNYREQALKLFEREKYFYGQLATMHSLIYLNYQLQNVITAEDYIRQAEKLSAKLKDNYFLGVIYSQIGDYYFDNFSDDKALDFYQKSLAISRAAGMKYNNAKVLDKLGTIYQRKGQLDSARTHYDSSLEISRQILLKFSEAKTLFNLARLDDLENKNENALQNIEKSIEITELLSSNVSNSKLKTTYFSGAYERYELYIELLMKQNESSPDGDFAIRALQAAEKSRSRSMLETLLLSNANFTKDANPETLRREREIRSSLNLKSDKLTDLLSRNAGKDEVDKLDSEINELENQLETINADLRQKSPVYSAVKNAAPFDVADFQNRVLDQNSVLLEFSLGKDSSYLWVVGKNKIGSYVLPSESEIETKVIQLREFLASRETRKDETVEDYQARISKADEEYWKIAHDLSDRLFGQIADQISGKRLIIVADGKLHYFPLSALPLPNSRQNEPLLLTNEIVYEPSAALLTTLTQADERAKNSEDILVFSDPVFSADDARLTKNETNSASKISASFRFANSLDTLSRLFATKEEADSILSIVGSTNSTGISGFDATRQKFLETDISRFKILHFATHGLINEERPELSGIVLSRFDKNGGKLNESIRLQDIYGLNLHNDLVVLSACNTGIGKEIKGEGLMSLNNAFLQSGSKSVVSSLWKVDDFAALELMETFYQKMSDENVSPSVALRLAQIKMWKNPQYKSPFYWAAFTFHGDFQNKPEFSKSVGYTKFFILSSVLFALALLFGGMWFYFKKIKKAKQRSA